METRSYAVLLVSLLLASLLALPGCTSNKFVKCCAKSGLYEPDGTERADPQCFFQDETLFGPCTLDEDASGVALCQNGTACSSILQQDDCEKTASCTWDGSQTPKCAGGDAEWVLPVCADRVPRSCVNDACSAMVCGYTSIRPAPPPASQDWDAANAAEEFEAGTTTVMSASEAILPTVNLQGATCDFNAMNNKLYNKVRSSRGALWVNSFRFGVGSSFGDYEQSKYFFPATDRVCGTNPSAKVDRFTTYLNMQDKYCQPETKYYQCSGPSSSGLFFEDETTCQLYCGGGLPPYSCAQVLGAPRYICKQDGFAYGDEATCHLKCSIIDDPNACANDKGRFPFLDTDTTNGAHFRTKYVSDYMVDTSLYYEIQSSSPSTCTMYGGPTGSNEFSGWWVYTPDASCLDYSWDGEDWVDGPWFDTLPEENGDPGPLRTYFDNHAYSALDFDYSYYKEMLSAEYEGTEDENGQLPFECRSSSECISGTCDTTYYKRSMCVNADTDAPLACGCSEQAFGDDQTPYPACYFGENEIVPLYADSHIFDESTFQSLAVKLNNFGPTFHPDQSYHDATGEPTQHYIYYAPKWGEDKPALFEACGLPSELVQKCIMRDYALDCTEGECIHVISAGPVIKEPFGSECRYECFGEDGCPVNEPNPKSYWEYDIDLGADPSRLGICKLNGENGGGSPTPASQPYLEMTDLGWCAGCTYATLAVQKVEWGKETNPGGEGEPRAYSCYEYRGEFNYEPSELQYPYGGAAGEDPAPWNDLGVIRWDQEMASPSTEPVRKNSNPSSYQYDTDGNLGPSGLAHLNGDTLRYFSCEDGWHGSGGWWEASEIPTPSAPYLKEKLTSYLQSNVMPILDEMDAKTSAADEQGCSHSNDDFDNPYKCVETGVKYQSKSYCERACFGACEGTFDSEGGWWCTADGRIYGQGGENEDACGQSCFASTEAKSYPPLSICSDMGGDGAVLHAIGNTSMLSSTSPSGDYGSVAPASLSADLAQYMGIEGSDPVAFEISPEGGKNAILARTYLLKEKCKTTPLVGLEIMPGEDISSLIGTPEAPGKLRSFFYDPDAPGYAQRYPRGIVDKYPGEVDLLLQDWYPTCSATGGLPGEAEIYEIESRLELSRALLSNFSKPSLIWKFAFPSGSPCDQEMFLDYLFNNTAGMVDSGIIGIIYSDWKMADGKAYGPETRSYSDPVNGFYGDLDTGLSLYGFTKVRGSDAGTVMLDNPVIGKGSLFCALEKYSRKVIGYTRLTYGQKLYAEDRNCLCEECSAYDFATGVCDRNAPSDSGIPQLFCNDGTACEMPAGHTDYENYRCEYRCVDENACRLCSSPSHDTDASFCRITESGGQTYGYSLPYANFSDVDWEPLTGLSASEKCCLESTDEGREGSEYTYVSLTGTKMQSEFIQYPTRGEQGIDCGRAPDTSVLQYCNIRVPLSQKDIACMQIEKPPTQIIIYEDETTETEAID
ncbi:MAG: hypothetical protein WC717_04975 [Candidatus Micrarchaeia archaeon]|jgi:hypothetical protein